MIVTVRDPNILKTLEPHQVAAYLQKHGWYEQSRDDDKSSISPSKLIKNACLFSVQVI
jgi:hypothetical protein